MPIKVSRIPTEAQMADKCSYLGLFGIKEVEPQVDEFILNNHFIQFVMFWPWQYYLNLNLLELASCTEQLRHFMGTWISRWIWRKIMNNLSTRA